MLLLDVRGTEPHISYDEALRRFYYVDVIVDERFRVE